MDEIPCPVCEGSRLKKEAQFFKIDEQNHRIMCNGHSDLTAWFKDLTAVYLINNNVLLLRVIKEKLRTDSTFLMNVGLNIWL
jgi:excinuclease ABC subunit A